MMEPDKKLHFKYGLLIGFCLPFLGFVIGLKLKLKGIFLGVFCIGFSFVGSVILWGLKELYDVYKPLPTGFDFLDWNVSLAAAIIGCVLWACAFVVLMNLIHSFNPKLVESWGL